MRTTLSRLGLVLAASGALLVPPTAAPPVQAAGAVRAAIGLTGPASGTWGQTANLAGTLWRYGTSSKLAGQTVVLQRSVHGRNQWTNAGTRRTSTSGRFVFTVTLRDVYDYRAYYGGSGTYTAAVSARQFTPVRRMVLLDSLKTIDHGGREAGLVRASGRAFPVPPRGVTVQLQRYDTAARSWITVGRSVSSGSANLAVDARLRGSVSPYRLAFGAAAPYYGNVSSARTFAHYVWRGVHHRPVLASGGSTTRWHRVEPPKDAPLRSSAYIGAGRNGISWIDVNTSGCIAMDHRGLNYTHIYTPSTRIRVGVQSNGRWLAAADVAPGQNPWLPRVKLTSARTRLLVAALSPTGETLTYDVTWVLCNN